MPETDQVNTQLTVPTDYTRAPPPQSCNRTEHVLTFLPHYHFNHLNQSKKDHSVPTCILIRANGANQPISQTTTGIKTDDRDTKHFFKYHHSSRKPSSSVGKFILFTMVPSEQPSTAGYDGCLPARAATKAGFHYSLFVE